MTTLNRVFGAGLFVLLAGCGSRTDYAVGNGSNTNWLSACETQHDCSVGICASGVCTPTCENNSDCSALRDDARCASETAVVEQATDVCGGAESRRVCAPACDDDADCSEAGAAYACKSGVCTPAQCGTTYTPCAGKACGDGCTLCDPSDAACVESKSVKACDGSGQCVNAPVTCQTCPGSADLCFAVDCANLPVDECATTAGCAIYTGQRIADCVAGNDEPISCIIVGTSGPPSAACGIHTANGVCYQFRSALVPAGFEATDCADTRCDTSATCAPMLPSYDACENKACGDACEPCAPNAICAGPTEATRCDSAGQCVTGDVQCIDCTSLSLDDCAATPECDLYHAQRIAECVRGSIEPVSCVPAGFSGPPTAPCAVDSNTGACYQFGSAYVPAGFEATECASSACDTSAECVPMLPAYDPCADKACGEVCRTCAPDAVDCIETEEAKACDTAGLCVSQPVECTYAACSETPIEACSSAGCAVVSGWLPDDEERGAVTQVPLGCQQPDAECPSAISCAIDTNNQCWRFGGCVPSGYETVQCSAAHCCVGLECEQALSLRWAEASFTWGECQGECQYHVRRGAASARELTLEVCDTSGVCGRLNSGRLTQVGMEALVAAETELNDVVLESRYGCPDCADGGAVSLTFDRPDGATAHSYEYGTAPPVFEALDALLVDVRSALNTCMSTDQLEVQGDCAPQINP